MIKMSKTKFIVLSVIILMLICSSLILVGPIMSNVETPEYNIIAKEMSIEIREYQPILIAQVTVKGTREEAINNGFKVLAKYIFGDNRRQSKVAMTAPVMQEAHSANISMTAPVTQKKIDDTWAISFVMPSEFTVENLPLPNNNNIVISEVMSEKIAVITFSGTTNSNILEQKTKELIKFLEDNNYKYTSEVRYAFYNPPWTVPFLRRNEVMIPIVYDR
jgi:effector-binding domain-containing protein